MRQDQFTQQDPTKQHAAPGSGDTTVEYPGRTGAMDVRPDHGEHSYRGLGRLQGKKAVITGGDSGIGRAVIDRTVREFGQIDVLVSNAAYQMSQDSGIEAITTEQFDRVMKTNVYALFWLCKAAVPHMPPGSTIITSSSVQAFQPSPHLMDYAASKAAIVNFTKALGHDLIERGIRANSVAPGPVWTPLIPATMPEDKLKSFGAQAPMGRAAQPAELAPFYVFLASQESSYMTSEVLGVTGGSPIT